MRFTAYGHKNVLSTHKTTVEFTKDEHLTKNGDCIIAVNADFEHIDLNPGRIQITIFVDDMKDVISAEFNESFSSVSEMVIRKSDFLDSRTFAINADKAACDIDRRIVEKLTNPDNKAVIDIVNL